MLKLLDYKMLNTVISYTFQVRAKKSAVMLKNHSKVMSAQGDLDCCGAVKHLSFSLPSLYVLEPTLFSPCSGRRDLASPTRGRKLAVSEPALSASELDSLVVHSESKSKNTPNSQDWRRVVVWSMCVHSVKLPEVNSCLLMCSVLCLFVICIKRAQLLIAISL